MGKVLFFGIMLIIMDSARGSVNNSKDFFPTDLTLVTWSHGTNSKAALQKAFTDKVKMIEADMQLGKTEDMGDNDDPIPIMAHDAGVKSDLSFKEFMDKVIEKNADREESELQGIKLDFKSIQTVEPALKILADYTSEQIKFPIWLNADILRGPVGSTGTPVNPSMFLNLTAIYRPTDTLSIGWTTRWGGSSGISEGQYTEDHINEMIELLEDHDYINQSTPITFPLRAGIAAQSLNNVMTLLKSSVKNPLTVTLWSSDNDPVDMDKLVTFINTVTKERCFTDLPFELPKPENNGIAAFGTSGVLHTVLIFVAIFHYLV